MKNLHFQKCQESDWQLIQKISLDTFINNYRDKNLHNLESFNQYLEDQFDDKIIRQELLNPNRTFYFLYKNENVLLGYLKLNVLDAQSEPMSDDYMEIERIYLLKEFQGNGYGKMMINFAKEKAIEKEKKKIWLGVWEENPNAIGFYHKVGFEKTGTHQFMLGEEEQVDFIMEMKIS